MKPVSIGFIAIGNVGSNLANNLLKSNNNVFVYDKNNQSYSRLLLLLLFLNKFCMYSDCSSIFWVSFLLVPFNISV